MTEFFNPLSANFTKWSKTLKQFVSNLSTNCLSVFDHFVGLALKGLMMILSTTCIVFRSLRRLERSSSTSSASFGSLSLRLFRFTLYSWHLLRGSVNCEGDAYGPPDSFISKSYVSCTECPSVNKVLSLSNVFVLVYGQHLDFQHSHGEEFLHHQSPTTC